MNSIDLTGHRYGRLIVIRYENRHARWLCRCDCGRKTTATRLQLRSSNTRSCGCLRREWASVLYKTRTGPSPARTHGMSGTKEYGAWAGMWDRTTNPKDDKFSHYGGRGITVCKRWRKFENFFADMGMAPSRAHSIDRKNNNGNYHKRNCRWATRSEQMSNRRSYTILRRGVA